MTSGSFTANHAAPDQAPRQNFRAALWLLAAFGLMFGATNCPASDLVAPRGEISGLVYTNMIFPAEPWSIHVVTVSRTGRVFEIHSRHAGSGALGLSTLSEQVREMKSESASPVAGLNGGFFRRDKTYAGAARGLQISGSEWLSAPVGSPCFWLDLNGEPHLDEVASKFAITWPDGKTTPFGLNSERPDDGVVLYTPAIGTSTRTVGGLEFILEREPGSKWLPLRSRPSIAAKVMTLSRAGNTPLTTNQMVISVGPKIMTKFQAVVPGAMLQLSTDSTPQLITAKNALSAGPILVRNGKRQKIHAAVDDAYESSSMLERHPRSAIGWNAEQFFLVEVDGRQRDLSDGMTLEELANFLVKLGCIEAVNLDGGGSATLWYDGAARNSPCDGYERPIANSLVVTVKSRKPAAQATSGERSDRGGNSQP